jgi:hypothetical protein
MAQPDRSTPANEGTGRPEEFAGKARGHVEVQATSESNSDRKRKFIGTQKKVSRTNWNFFAFRHEVQERSDGEVVAQDRTRSHRKFFLTAGITLALLLSAATIVAMITRRGSAKKDEPAGRSAVGASESVHTIRIEIVVHNEGSVGGHISRYEGSTKPEIDMTGNQMRVPVRGVFTTLMARDDSQDSENQRVTRSRPWIEETTVSGYGIYVLDLADWNDSPDTEVRFSVDGVVRFEGRSTEENYRDWAMKKFGPKTRQTDDREVAVQVGD